MKRKFEKGDIVNATQLITNREYVDIEKTVRNKLKSAPQFIHRLELEKELSPPHAGCVNCLEWSDNGHLLASGSDDFRIKIWDSFRYKLLTDIATPHHGNIFSVKFMPKCNNQSIVSGAADSKIFVFDLNRTEIPTWSCHCHANRVKRLAVAPESPHVFWSSSEDGEVFEFDLREPHICHSSKVSLINLKNHFKDAQIKCIAVNPRRPEMIAIGSNDCYARIYDRRMMVLESLSTRTSLDDSDYPDLIPRKGATYFCPGHLRKFPENSYKAITYLTFNSEGTELLVNMGAEHIYLYDVNNNKEPSYLNLPPAPSVSVLSSPDSPYESKTPPIRKHKNGSSSSSSHHSSSTDSNGLGEGSSSSSSSSPQSKSCKRCDRRNGSKKRRESDCDLDRWDVDLDVIENRRSNKQITQLTRLIQKNPNVPRTIFNRASQLMIRGFNGDPYAALRDLHTALWLDPNFVIGYYRLAQCLFKLHYYTEAYECLQELKSRFTSYVDHIDVKKLEGRITEHMKKSQRYHHTDCQDFPPLTDNESYWRATARDYQDRFLGHCNTTTDIKEANFFGSNFIIAGSDDGNFYIWERATNLVTEVYKGDSNIVNCVNPHPSICLLATSGIEHSVKLWSPQPVENFIPKHRVDFSEKTMKRNQDRMHRTRMH